MTVRERSALTAASALLLITGGWWALAFWPVASETSLWLTRAKSVCFGLTPSGLPDASGWVALVSQPLVMGGMFLSIWGKSFGTALESLGSRTGGRFALALPLAAIALGIGGVSWRVASASQISAFDGVGADQRLPSTYPRLDRDAPALSLVNQNGEIVDLERFAGRPVLVTFAFGNCEAICPMVVHDLLEARRRLNETAGVDVGIIVITLDPWRDVPSRLPHMADQWGLDGDAHVLGGSIQEVESVLDAWEVPRSREEETGNIVHPRLSFVVDYSGRLAYAVNAGPNAIIDLVNRL